MFILKKLFYPLFFLLLTFSFFLIEMDFLYILYSLWSIFIFTYFLVWKIKIKFTKDFVLLLFFLLAILISLIFSHHHVFSLEKALFYFVSVEIYLLFRFLPKKAWDKKEFFNYFSLLSLVLNIFVLVGTFLPEIKDLFPGMNLLVKTYGHNHYVSFLLLAIPIFWWDLFNQKNKTNFFLILSSYLIIFLSFARVALLIAFIQLLLILLISMKSAIFRKKYSTNSFLKILLFAFSLILLSYFLTTTSLIEGNEWFCHSFLTEKKLCEAIYANNRTNYWTKAFEIFKNYPVTGYGLKTFRFAEHRLGIEDLTQTSYAHNIFMHLLAEAGIFSSIFLLLFFFNFFKKGLKKNNKFKKEDRNLYYLLILAISSSLFNALFDFDFNFFIIFSITLLFAALIFNEKKDEKININIFIFLITTISILFSANYLLTGYLLKTKNIKPLLQLPQNSKTRREIMTFKHKMSEEDKRKLFKIYQNDPTFLFNLRKSENISEEFLIEINEQLIKIDLISFLKNLDFSELNSKNNNKVIELLLSKDFSKILENEHYFPDYKVKENISKQLFKVAEKNYKEEKLKEASNAYKLAIIFDDTIMAKKKAIFLSEDNINQSIEFIKLFTVEAELMHEYFFKYIHLYETILISLFIDGNLEQFYQLTDRILIQEENFSFFLFKEITNISIKNKQYSENLKQIYQQYSQSPAWKEIASDLDLENFKLIF